MFKRIAAAASAVALFSASSAMAAPQDFKITNETGHVVMELHVSPSGETRWGPDILGVEVLGDGESATVTFDGVNPNACLWDIKVKYSDGDEGDWRQINLCETSEITLGGE